MTSLCGMTISTDNPTVKQNFDTFLWMVNTFLSHIQLYVNVCVAYILTSFFPDSDSHHSSTGGAVYIRWGRTTCPGNDTTLVYAGKYINASFNGKQRQPTAVMHVNELIQMKHFVLQLLFQRQ